MATEIFIPKMGANIDVVDIGKIYKSEGDKVKKGEILFEIITDKATFDIEADADGIILSLECREGQTIKVLEVLGYIGYEGEQIPIKNTQISQNQKDIKATPAAKKLAKDNNIELSITFSNFNGIIKEHDVIDYINNNNITDQIDTAKEKLSPRKLAEIKNLTKNKEYIYSSITISLPTNKLKEKIKKFSEDNKIRLSIFEYITYIAAKSIEKYPLINSYYENEMIIKYKNINIGIAMNGENGLIVPVLYNTNNLDLLSLSEKMKELIMKNIKNKFELNDIENCTFTITDLSSYGVINFIPVINFKQCAILGICAEYGSCKNENDVLIYEPNMNLV